MNRKTQIILMISVFLSLGVLTWLSTKDPIEQDVVKGELRELYSDSIKNLIVEIDYKLRSEHIILDDGREYFFHVKNVVGIEGYKSSLDQWLSPGDSLYKSSKENYFVVKHDEKKIIVTFFHNKK